MTQLPKAPILKSEIRCGHIYYPTEKDQRDADHQFYQAKQDKLEKELIEKGRKMCPTNEVQGTIYLEGVQQGRREVVEWIQHNYLIPSPTDKASQIEWQAKLKEWGLV